MPDFNATRRTGIARHNSIDDMSIGALIDFITTPSSPVAQLDHALDVIEQHGWGQTGEKLENEDGEVCLLGALLAGQSCYTETLEYVSSAVGVAPEALDDWNDQPGRTQEEVVAALQEARKLAMAAAEKVEVQ